MTLLSKETIGIRSTSLKTELDWLRSDVKLQSITQRIFEVCWFLLHYCFHDFYYTYYTICRGENYVLFLEYSLSYSLIVNLCFHRTEYRRIRNNVEIRLTTSCSISVLYLSSLASLWTEIQGICISRENVDLIVNKELSLNVIISKVLAFCCRLELTLFKWLLKPFHVFFCNVTTSKNFLNSVFWRHLNSIMFLNS